MEEKKYSVEMTIEEYADYIERKYQPGKEYVVRCESVNEIIYDDVFEELIERGYSEEQVLLFRSRCRMNDKAKDSDCKTIEVNVDDLDKDYIIYIMKSLYPEFGTEFCGVKQFLSKESMYWMSTKEIVKRIATYGGMRMTIPGDGPVASWVEYRLLDKKKAAKM